jgi:hypothetical protein
MVSIAHDQHSHGDVPTLFSESVGQCLLLTNLKKMMVD